MGNLFRNLKLLLWKNFLLKFRNLKMTILELGVPLFLALVLLLLRHSFKSTNHPDNTVYPPFSIQSLPSNLTAPVQDPKWHLGYINKTNSNMVDVMNLVSSRLSVTVEGFLSEEDFIKNEIELQTKDSKFVGLIAFNDSSFLSNGSFSEDIQFKIRMSASQRNYKKSKPLASERAKLQTWMTDKQYPLFQIPGPRTEDAVWGGPPGYMSEGFLAIQHAVSMSLIAFLSKENDLPYVDMKRYPYPPYLEDQFLFALSLFFPVVILFSFTFSFFMIVKSVVYEKEKRLKESMKVMGLSNWLHWSAWFIKDFLFLFVSTIILVVLLSQVLQYSRFLPLLLFFVIYILNVITFGYFLSVFFKKANSASTASGLVFFLSYLPYVLVQQNYSTLTWVNKILLSLLGNTAMSFGIQIITMWEGTGAGLTFENLSIPASPDDDLTIAHTLIMMLIGSLTYGLLALYIEAVFPGEFGMPLPFYFPFMPSYWTGKVSEGHVSIDEQQDQGNFFEKDPTGLNAGISIKGLTKVYGSKTVAVDNLYLNMYKNQITALLGHNGAGKTTTMSLLTGIYPPTAGTAFVDDLDIRKNINKIRETLGFCPQHNVLFDRLTVEEHLQFFCTLKGCDKEAMKKDTDYMIKAMGLEDKRKVYAEKLSGGMKRKLSVGVALCGGSSVVMLDEPTAGMDPSARRSTWDLLNQEKTNRTILLTTHYMEEADILGDRIAIMANGKVQCCGSSMFLKKKYGAGYHMVLVQTPSCDVDAVSRIITNHVPNAELESNLGAELSYILPHESSANFQFLFQEIEDNKVRLGVNGYGASITTMEEVFIKVGENHETEETHSSNTSYNSLKSIDAQVAITPTLIHNKLKRNTGFVLLLQQSWALIVKRATYTVRNRLLVFAQLALPIIMIILSLIIIKTTPKQLDSPLLKITLDSYKYTKTPIVDLDTSNPVLAKIYNTYESYFDNDKNKLMQGDYDTEEKYIDYVADIGKKDLSKYTLHWIIGAMFSMNSTSNGMKLTALFNNQPYHSSPVSLLAIHNSLLKYYVGSNHSISISNYPLPRTADVKAIQEASQGRDGYQIAQNLMFGVTFLCTSFIMFLVKERAVRAKHLQVVSGVNLLTFWITTFIWDFINYMVPCIITVSMFAVFNSDGYKEPVVMGMHMLLLVMHGIASLPIIYSLSFMFSVPSSAYSKTSILIIILGISSLLAVVILEIPTIGKADVAKKLDWAFMFLPVYGLGRGSYLINQNFENNAQCHKLFDLLREKIPMLPKTLSEACKLASKSKSKQILLCCPEFCGSGDGCIQYSQNYVDWKTPGIGRILTFLFVDAVIYSLFLILIEMNIFRKIKYLMCKKSTIDPNSQSSSDHMIHDDEDVVVERERILKTPHNDLVQSETLIFKELTKNYGNLLAVDHLSLGIQRGECFGLLGINGAGKTSTFKMITGDEAISEGDAYFDGFSVKNEIVEVQKRLGYCPQFDALIDEFTGEETIRLFARLRGVPEPEIKEVIEYLAEELLLSKYLKKKTQDYSGGNKRKLSTAIALVGEPPMVFLDEPTAGVDPVARRSMWKTICQVKQSGRSILLTSHSMEECEALCGRLVIMVNGRFCCLGSPQHLKNKFGKGYTVLVKINTEEDDNITSIKRPKSSSSSIMFLGNMGQTSNSSHSRIDAFLKFLKIKFDDAELISIHGAFIHHHIPIGENAGWAKIFGTMETAKEEYHIEDYSVSQTSLEQIFLQFAKMQRFAE